MAAEASLQRPSISLESLSYRFLVNPTISTADELSDYEGSFIEMDPRLPPSKRFNPIFWNNLNPHDFKFDEFPEMQPPPQTLVPADKLFAEGKILPLFESSPPRRPNVEMTSPDTRKRRCCLVSKRVLCKYLVGLFMPLCLVSQWCRGSSSRVEAEDVKTRFRVGQSDDRSQASPCDSESSIHEAVLHCKRSSGTRLRVE